MLTLSPPFFPSFGWPLEDPISQEHDIINNNNSFYRDFSLETNNSDHSLLPSPHSDQSSRPHDQTGGDHHITGMTVKKLNHNASERDRRKKINNLYSSLFSLLPAADRAKKLSIPATVSCVVKYIPELQKEVDSLIQKKEELSSRNNSSRQQEDDDAVQVDRHKKKRRKIGTGKCLSVINVSSVGAKDIVIHICSPLIKNNKMTSSLLYQTVHNLEEGEEGLVLLNASSFHSLGSEKVFHNLHFQAQGIHKLDVEIIRRNIMSLYEKSGEEMHSY